MSMRAAFIERFNAVPAPVQGAVMMTGAALGFSLMAGLIRFASESLEPLQVVFFRNFFALLFMLPWLSRAGFAGLRTRHFGLHLSRAVVGLVSMGLWFTSIAVLPLAQAVSLNFTVPLFATAGAALVLGEVVRARRWSATVVGFLGVLVIVRPGFQEVSPLLALPILAALFMATAAMMVKTLARSENANAMVFYMNFFLAPLSLVPALFVWRWPGWEVLTAMAGVGLIAVLAHILVARSFKLADASAVIPFQYSRLPFTALVGYLFFAEVPDAWTFVGAGIIAAAAIYIAQREASVAREQDAVSSAAREETLR